MMTPLSIHFWELLVSAAVLGIGAFCVIWVALVLRRSELRHRELTERLDKLMARLD